MKIDFYKWLITWPENKHNYNIKKFNFYKVIIT